MQMEMEIVWVSQLDFFLAKAEFEFWPGKFSKIDPSVSSKSQGSFPTILPFISFSHQQNMSSSPSGHYAEFDDSAIQVEGEGGTNSTPAATTPTNARNKNLW